jgi:hypothetical protein
LVSTEIYALWIECVQAYGATDFKDLGDIVCGRGQWELMLKQDVDNYVDRLGCAPQLDRKDGIHLYQAWDKDEFEREVVVLREWEAQHATINLPTTMRLGPIVFFTGRWEEIPLEWAPKKLHTASTLPSVHDATLSQHRLNEHQAPQPLQHDYPVWYFLTGSIARPENMRTLWKLDSLPYYRHATADGLTSIRYGKCEALIQSSSTKEEWHTKKSVGTAYLVMDKLSEDRLRYFKTHLFKVIRCKITFCPLNEYAQSHVVNGLTFIYDQDLMNEAVIRSTPAQPDLNAEPSLAFEGYATTLPTEIDSQGRPFHSRLRYHSFVFPVLKIDRPVPHYSTMAVKRTMYNPQNRRRSPLVPNSPPSPPSLLVSVPEEGESSSRCGSVLDTIGSHLTRTGERSTYTMAGNWRGEPLGITTNTTYTEAGSSSEDDGNTVECIEVIQFTSGTAASTDPEAPALIPGSLPTEETTTGTGTGTTEGVVHVNVYPGNLARPEVPPARLNYTIISRARAHGRSKSL